jgi:hypothetical protein
MLHVLARGGHGGGGGHVARSIEPQDREAKPSPVTLTVDGGLVSGFILNIFLHA